MGTVDQNDSIMDSDDFTVLSVDGGSVTGVLDASSFAGFSERGSRLFNSILSRESFSAGFLDGKDFFNDHISENKLAKEGGPVPEFMLRLARTHLWEGDKYSVISATCPNPIAKDIVNLVTETAEANESTELNHALQLNLMPLRYSFNEREGLSCILSTRKLNKNIHKGIYRKFPKSSRAVVGKHFIHLLENTSFYYALERLSLFVLINEMVNSRLEAKTNVSIKTLFPGSENVDKYKEFIAPFQISTKQECQAIFQGAYDSFMALDYPHHEYTDSLADLILLDTFNDEELDREFTLMSALSQKDKFPIMTHFTAQDYMDVCNYLANSLNKENTYIVKKETSFKVKGLYNNYFRNDDMYSKMRTEHLFSLPRELDASTTFTKITNFLFQYRDYVNDKGHDYPRGYNDSFDLNILDRVYKSSMRFNENATIDEYMTLENIILLSFMLSETKFIDKEKKETERNNLDDNSLDHYVKQINQYEGFFSSLSFKEIAEISHVLSDNNYNIPLHLIRSTLST